MMTDFKLIAGRLVTEIRKDIYFFGTCGVVVGLLMLWQFKLKTLGVATGKAWPTELFPISCRSMRSRWYSLA